MQAIRTFVVVTQFAFVIRFMYCFSSFSQSGVVEGEMLITK